MTSGRSKASCLAAVVFFWLHAPAFGGSCSATDEIVSNDMRLLAGSGDTVWIAGYSTQGWGVNYTVDRGNSWHGNYLACYDAGLTDMAFGSGMLAVILNPADIETSRSKPGTVWSYSLVNKQARTFTLQWPDTVFRADSLAEVAAVDVLAAGGFFFFACHHGGLLRWNPATNDRRAWLPGNSVSFDPAQFKPDRSVFGKPRTKVLALDHADSAGVTRIVVATPPRLLLFNPADSSWDSTSVAAAMADPALQFQAYLSPVVNNTVSPPLLYAYLYYRENGRDSILSLFRYHTGGKQWSRIFKEAPFAVTTAARGSLYTLQGKNQMRLYRDSVSDLVIINADSLKPLVTEQEFDVRLILGNSIPKPDALNDLLFMPASDSSGVACVASSDGLFVSWSEVPGVSAVKFDYFKRARAIKNGLAETYALPGIITDDARKPQAFRTTFVYKLGSDANVTIRVYDYAMHLVRTVVENAPRKAVTPLGQGRSTDSRYDVWDGTTVSGRTVAPGVYYYKITASTGERSFGKIVVAKGQGN